MKGGHWFINVLFLHLTLKELTLLIYSYSLIKRTILTSNLQKKYVYKNRVKKSRYRKECQVFAGIFKSLLISQSACCLLSIIVCNTTKSVTDRVKILEKPF